MHRGQQCEWSDETIARLKRMHAEGIPTAEIARRMNLSKNTVGGKISRLHLNEGRPPLISSPTDPRQASPRRRDRVVPMRNPKHTLPPLASLA